MSYDAIVIGGGVVGASVAYHLVTAGAKTLLVDRQDNGWATGAGAGILAPETSARDGDAWFAFAVQAVAYYPELVAQLAALDAGDTSYAICGQLTVAVSEDEIAPYAETRRIVFARQEERRTPANADLHEVSSDQARALFPPLAITREALYYRHAGRVDGRLLALALKNAAIKRGLDIQQTSAGELVIQNGAVRGVMINGQPISAGAVAIAGGAWSQRMGDQLGVQIAVEPQRGQIIHLDLPGTDTSSWPIINAFHGHYMVPWHDSRVVVGATRETGAGFAPHTTAAGVRQVLDEALRVAPGLAHASIREIRVGLRPLTADGLPVLGTVPGVDGVYLATGHGATGLQLGPFSGKVIAELMGGKQSDVDISAFAVTRF